MPDYRAYNVLYRPESYWGSFLNPFGRIKGQLRRNAAQAALARRERPEIPDNLLRESIPLALRDLIGSVDPRMRGGEDLPDYVGDEVEIARIHTPNTVHAEAISIRARPKGGRIFYRVVDEYGTKYKVKPRSSRLPLTMAELIDLINTADSGYEHGKGLVVSIWHRFTQFEFNEEELHEDVVVQSDYYEELGGWYEELLEEWLDTHRPAGEN